MNKKLIYVGGKYGGVEENKKLIEKAISHLKTMDKDKLNSVFLFDMTEKVYISPMHSFGFMYEDTEYLEGLDYCLTLLSKCDECVLLSNWEESTGAKIEYGFCKGHDILIKILDINKFA
ncbi:MAG: DUF4406 domain-containing protein [Terrisporobacter othiniensis]|nr:DUF4406 domain-containing protein [Terrisporobacter othiniensis]